MCFFWCVFFDAYCVIQRHSISLPFLFLNVFYFLFDASLFFLMLLGYCIFFLMRFFFWSFTPKMKRTAQTFCWWNQRKCWQEYFWCWIDTSWCIWCHSEAAKAFLPCFFETIFCAQNNGIFFCNAHHENTETYHPRPAPCYITIITLW